ncbi:MAG: DNA-binding response regulator, partial [Planctomycetes bacterium]|nr:DNA-binding response regulator [Planctomycetota bacterium]
MSEPNATSTAGPLVLVVDDELHVRRFLKTGLSSHAYR